jgi:hypothetical protein
MTKLNSWRPWASSRFLDPAADLRASGRAAALVSSLSRAGQDASLRRGSLGRWTRGAAAGAPDPLSRKHRVPRPAAVRDMAGDAGSVEGRPLGNDEAWVLVLVWLESRTLSSMCLVCKRFLRLCTSEHLFRHQSVRFVGEQRALAARASAVSWRHVFRNAKALRHPPPAPVPDFLPFPNTTVSLLAVAFVRPPCAVFYDHGSDEILAWPLGWRRRRTDVTACSPGRIQSSVVSLRNGAIVLFDVGPSDARLSVINAADGCVVATHRVPSISTAWTTGAVHRAPTGVPAGLDGSHVAFVSGDCICVLDVLSGDVPQRWPADDRSPFARVVRGPGGSAVGIVAPVEGDFGGSHRHAILDIRTGAPLAQFTLAAAEALVDVVVSGDLKTVACRVVSVALGLVVCVISSLTCGGMPHVARYRVSLCKAPASVLDVRPSAEFSIVGHEGLAVFYRPEQSVLPFRGSITVVLCSRDRDEFSTHACVPSAGGSFRSAHLSSDARLLMTCSDDVVSTFDLASGACVASHSVGNCRIADAFLLSLEQTHALIIVSTARRRNLQALHFSSFCRPGRFPTCCR